MPKPYTSKSIQKYTLICNVMYGATLTVNGQNVEMGKDYYNDVYCYFAFDKSEKKFYEERFFVGCKLKIQNVLFMGQLGWNKCFRPELLTAITTVHFEKKFYGHQGGQQILILVEVTFSSTKMLY